eukprot:g28650.t1
MTVITNWVRSALGSVIHPDQTCALLGRTVSESLVFLRDIITYVQDRGIDVCAISLNQEKTFDRIWHTYILMCIYDQFELAFGIGSQGKKGHVLWELGRLDRISEGLDEQCPQGHHIQSSGKGNGKNVSNAILILMAIFMCSSIKLRVDPWYRNTKCHCILRFYLSLVLQRMAQTFMPQNAPSSWTVPYHRTFMEKFA